MRHGIGVGIGFTQALLAIMLGAVTWSRDLATSTDTEQFVTELDNASGVITVPNAAMGFAFGSAPSGTGNFRFPATGSPIKRRKADNLADLAVLTLGATDAFTLGDASTGTITVQGSKVSLTIASTERGFFDANGLTLPGLTTAHVVTTTTGGRLTSAATVPLANLSGITNAEIAAGAAIAQTKLNIANAVSAGAAGYMTGADKAILDALATNAVLGTRTLTASTGLTGGGTLAADRSFAVDFGNGTGKALEALKASIETTLALSTSGLVRSTTGVLSSAAATVVNADVDAAAAIAGSKISPNFAAQDVITTGTLRAGGATVGSVGTVRLSATANQIVTRNNGNTADLGLVSTDSSNNLYLGSSNSLTTLLVAGILFAVASNGQYQFYNGNGGVFVQMHVTSGTESNISFANVGIPSRLMAKPRITDAATSALFVQAMSAHTSATGTNRNGGALILESGARTNTSGKRGSIALSLNGVATEYMLEVGDVQDQNTKPSRVAAFFLDSPVATSDMPSDTGDKVFCIAEAGAVPTASPGNSRVVAYASGTTVCDLFKRTPAGHQTSLGSSAKSRTWPSDANYTAVLADYSATTLELTGGSLSATRNLVMPLVLGYQWTIVNNTSGAQSIQVIGASGTGVTIATGKTAIVRADGTNIVRVTADV